jgi:hypothetical protein
MKVQHTFNGTGAAVYLCLGFIPDYVKIISGEDADLGMIEWYRNAGCAEIARGIHNVGISGVVQQDARTVADGGIVIYDGGEELTVSNQTSIAYGEGVYLAPDTRDFRLSSVDVLNPGDGSGDDVMRWVLGNGTNKTGNFLGVTGIGADVVGTYVGEGSRIKIRSARYGSFPEYDAMITALTAGQGGAANEVTLDRAIPSGDIVRLGGKFGLAPMARGLTTLPGILLEMTSVVNVNDETQLVIAEKFTP